MRRSDLDLLRVVLCASVILQHAVLIFAAEPRYHVKAATVSASATAVYEVLRIFAMPPFFVLAGWAAVMSLRRRGVAGFLRERALRLLVPLTAGIVLLGPAIKYIELSGGRDLGLTGFRLVAPLRTGFWEFAGRYFTRLSLLTWSHLWFLAYLLVFCIVALPLLWHLARRPTVPGVPHRVWAYLPAVPLVLLLAGWHGYWPYLPNLLTDWTNAAYFLVCFVIGGGMAVRPGFEQRLRTEAPFLALVAAAGLAVVLTWGESLGGRIAVGVAAWGCIGAAWGFAMRLRPARTAMLTWLAEASMPLYVLHHLPLLLIARTVLPWDFPTWPAIAAIAVGDLVISFALLLVVLPWNPVRLLAGMQPLRARSKSSLPEALLRPVSRT